VKRVELLSDMQQAFSAPTRKQQEAYARLLHTLAAASLIGEVTVIFAEGMMTSTALFRIAGLTVSGVTCFIMGALLLKGE
jgi:hypothetical protein